MAKKIQITDYTQRDCGYRYCSPNIPLSAIRRYARQIAEKFQPDKIILFGSYAYGTPHQDSDVDLLVVMPAWNNHSKANRITSTIEPPFCLDLKVRTPKEVERDVRDGDWFLTEVVTKGKVLYEKADCALGPKSRRRPDRSKSAKPPSATHS
jgi:predicted nucleotidyltransferase